MDVVGSEIGQKMRSAIKAKLTELGCYVDDELPDYVMVMVANKRTRSQMDEDLQLFLGDNTEMFVNWLHQVLKKLQEVTVTTPLEAEKKEKSKDKKSKEKKDKGKLKKLDIVKDRKLKKKDKVKDKSHKKKDKEDKKVHKSKKKSKHHEMIRPNIPPLLMNIEKESEPSITDVFAGQILKNHGVLLESPKSEKVDIKPVITELQRPIKPIIDPATITQPDVDIIDTEVIQSEDITETEVTQSEEITETEVTQSEEITETEVTQCEEITETEVITQIEEVSQEKSVDLEDEPVIIGGAPREEQIKEINEIEAKIQGLKQKLAEQLDSMSDDEDFLNIRTEAEELMNDFAEDVFQEISAQAPTTPPHKKSPSPIQTVPKPIMEKEVLPQIELNLPKRPIRERLGVKSVSDIDREPKKIPEKHDKRTESPERLTPEKEPDFWPKSRSAKSRLGSVPEKKRRSFSDDSDKSDDGSKKHSSRKSISSSRRNCASVVVVRPRPRVSSASALLMRAVADAHKSLLTQPSKSQENQPVKQATVLPMRRCVDPHKIVIQVQGDRSGIDEPDRSYKMLSDTDGKEEYVPASITKKINNTDYVPSRRPERTSSRKDDSIVIETINIHNTTVDKDKNTQFIVTMDGFNTNAFLAKKLLTEGLLNDEDELVNKPIQTKSVLRTKDTAKSKNDNKNPETTENSHKNTSPKDKVKEKTPEGPKVKDNSPEYNKSDEKNEIAKTKALQNKRLSNTSDESDTQIIINQDISKTDREKRSTNVEKRSSDVEKRRIDIEQKSAYVEKRSSDVEKRRIDIEQRSAYVEKRCSDVEKRKSQELDVSENSNAKKRKGSPIVFDMKKDKPKERARTESASSDNQVIVTTAAKHKFDAVPPLPAVTPATPSRPPTWCRTFPNCVFGASCMFQHPRCKFATACTRRKCAYSHPDKVHTVASHVVPVANFKSIAPTVPNVCKYYPNCANPTCHFYHPKPCRYGKACVNKLECNFYHSDLPSKFRYPV